MLTVGCDISRTVDLLPVPAESQLQLDEAARLRPLPNCQCDLARLRHISPSQVTHASSRLQRRRLMTGRIHIAVLRYQCIGRARVCESWNIPNQRTSIAVALTHPAQLIFRQVTIFWCDRGGHYLSTFNLL